MLERLKLWVDLKKGQFQNKYCKTYLPIKIFLHVNDCIVFLKQFTVKILLLRSTQSL